MMRINLESYTTDYISGVMSLRTPQKESLAILENIIEKTDLLRNNSKEDILKSINELYPICTDFERNFASLTYALATGVGKTRLMGAFIALLYAKYNIKNFLVVAPNTTIFEKLKMDLGNPSNEKYVFKGLSCFSIPPKVVSDDDYANRNISLFDSDITIYVYNISKFDKDNVKMKSFNEFLGMSFYNKLTEMKDLVVIMDESHHYRAKKGMEAINNLKPILGLELTATPFVNEKNKQVLFKNVVYEYPLSQAIKDGYTRVPYAMTRTDIDFYNFGDEALDKLMLNDGITFHKKIRENLKYYSRSTGKRLVKPFMLVVCKDTEHAEKVSNYIKSDEFENGFYKNKTIIINSKQSGAESDENMQKLLSVEKYDNPVEIVIHVNMLKEGWDVNNLYTIVPLRTASSTILREQMVGRGLRLPFGERTGNKDIDSVMLTAHNKFNEIIEEAQKGNSIFNTGNIIKIEDIEKEKTTYTQVSFGVLNNEKLANTLKIPEPLVKYEVADKINNVLVKNVENYIYENKNDEINSEDINKIKNNIEQEITSNKDYAQIYNENKSPIENWMNEAIIKTHENVIDKFIMIPKIKTEYTDGKYYFRDFELDTKKFSSFMPIENAILIRSLIDSSNQELINGDMIKFEAVNPQKILIELLREKAEIDYERDHKLLYKVIMQLTDYFQAKYGIDKMKNIIMMYKRELVNELYNQLIANFVEEYGIINSQVYIGRKKNIRTIYTSTSIKNIFDSYHSETDGKITSILFDGIEHGVFSSAKFDSEPELILARQLEREKDFVKTWLRPNIQEFDITYNNGKKYEPDFVVETNNTIYLVEVKADKDLEDTDVLAKKEKALEYCRRVSEWALSSGNKTWTYLLIPASKIGNNSTFKFLSTTCKVS